MSLPNELIDQILSFVHASTQPATLRSPRIRDVGLQPGALTMDARFQVDDVGGELRLVYDGFEDPGALSGPLDPSLKAVRLLSRAWNHGVSRLLARHWPVTIKTDDHDSITRALKRCTTGLGGAPRYLKLLAGQLIRPTIRIYHHDWRTMIHEVDSKGETPLRLFKDWPMPQGFDLGNDKSLRGRIERGNEYSNHGLQAGAGDIAISERLELLQNYLATAAKHKAANTAMSLSIVFPGAHSNTDTGSEDDLTSVADCYDLDTVRQLLDTAMNSGLRLHEHTLFANLTELRLLLPGTYHFSQLHKSCPQHVRETVRRLWVGVTDATGAGGSTRYLREDCEYQSYFEHEADFCVMDAQSKDLRQSIYAPSNLQLAYSNWDHQSALWKFVASFQSLETLGVDCTHYLQLDLLARLLRDESRDSGRTWQLKKLSLHRVYTDVASLRGLIDSSSLCQRPDSAGGDTDDDVDEEQQQQQHKLDPASDPCPIQRLGLDSVKIYADGGNWADLFEGLGHLDTPNLELVRVQELSYFNSHPYSEQPHRPWEDRSILWSGSDADSQALRMFLQSKAESATRRQCTMMAQLGGTLLGAKKILEDLDDSL